MKLPSRELIDRFRDAVARRFGLDFDDGKRDFLGEILAKQTDRVTETDAITYVHRLFTGQASQTETTTLAADLTVGETYFFRHPDQFRAFTDVALSGRQPQPGAAPRRLHILSAGCASGEEAYSLAILLRQYLQDSSGWDLRVTGIDLNPVSLAKAVRGRYTEWSLRGGYEALRPQYFQVVGKEYLLDNSIRAMVSFEERNLLDDAPDFWRPGAFDVIFCRNVIMYFTPEAARTVVARFTSSLTPGGFLFLGPAETLRGLSNEYHLQHTHDTFYYRRRLRDEKMPQTPVLSETTPRFLDAYIPELAAVDDSWVAAIGKASERIARLGREMKPVPLSGRGAGFPEQEVRPAPEKTGLTGSIHAAREMVRQERYADALQLLGSSADEGRRDPDEQLLRAAILTNGGQVAEAERLCHDVLTGDELNAEARYLLALCREHAGEYEAAMEQDGIAIYLDPGFAMPHLHLGLLRKRARDREGACRAFGDAAALLPREDTSRILLFGGGFSRDMLLRLCEAELRAGGDDA
ncbi:CheR family methyltransferase [Zavarzinella formosa]|uniref:CheR family methyltransferase n=1 Tax=Zavarzinella formosa TaxID=360055 RepID=UPI0003075C5F|nr:protein-glutamate O-methyltransferase CheR [Zavarzinella formosa]